MDESITMKFVIKNSSQCMLTLILLMQRIGWAPNNARRWQMGFSSAFKGLSMWYVETYTDEAVTKWFKNSIHLNWKNLIDQMILKFSWAYYAVRSIFHISNITNQFAGSSSSSSTCEFQNLWFLVFSAIWWLKPSSLRSSLETGERPAGLWDLI
jgi:hypothetical protein